MSFVHNNTVELSEVDARQRTIRHPIECRGTALHLGGPATVVLEPAPVDFGIRFSVEHLGIRAMKPSYSCDGNHTVSAHLNGRIVLATEHLFSALSGLGVTNVHVRVIENFELPIGDGSADFYARRIIDSGIQDQRGKSTLIALSGPTHVADRRGSSIHAYPYDGLRIDATIDFATPAIGVQKFSLVVTPETYCRELAPARTFLQDSIDATPLLRVSERLKGFDPEVSPALVYDDASFLMPLRFVDEPVRHKIADFIGDLYTLPFAVHGHFVINKPGHAINVLFADHLRKSLPGNGAWPS